MMPSDNLATSSSLYSNQSSADQTLPNSSPETSIAYPPSSSESESLPPQPSDGTSEDALGTELESDVNSSSYSLYPSRTFYSFDAQALRQRFSTATQDANLFRQKVSQTVSTAASSAAQQVKQAQSSLRVTVNPEAHILKTKLISCSSTASSSPSISTPSTSTPSTFRTPELIHNSSSSERVNKVESSKTAKDKDKYNETKGEDNSAFECNICFDTVNEPVVTLCGHLFCWPCLHSWFSASPPNNPILCPVCKAGTGREKVVPVFARGKAARDPRNNHSKSAHAVPPRPSPQRPEPERREQEFGTGVNGAAGFQFHAGFGFFPGIGFSYTMPNDLGTGSAGTPRGGDSLDPTQHQIHDLLSRILLCFGVFIIIRIIFP